MRKELCIDTFNAAAGKFPLRGAILHSDYAEVFIIPKNIFGTCNFNSNQVVLRYSVYASNVNTIIQE